VSQPERLDRSDGAERGRQHLELVLVEGEALEICQKRDLVRQVLELVPAQVEPRQPRQRRGVDVENLEIEPGHIEHHGSLRLVHSVQERHDLLEPALADLRRRRLQLLARIHLQGAGV
jgi:hypothetical protein